MHYHICRKCEDKYRERRISRQTYVREMESRRYRRTSSEARHVKPRHTLDTLPGVADVEVLLTTLRESVFAPTLGPRMVLRVHPSTCSDHTHYARTGDTATVKTRRVSLVSYTRC